MFCHFYNTGFPLRFAVRQPGLHAKTTLQIRAVMQGSVIHCDALAHTQETVTAARHKGIWSIRAVVMRRSAVVHVQIQAISFPHSREGNDLSIAGVFNDIGERFLDYTICR